MVGTCVSWIKERGAGTEETPGKTRKGRGGTLAFVLSLGLFSVELSRNWLPPKPASEVYS